MLRTFRADLHIHTCLSPCADITMSPRAVIEAALAKGLDMIAVCDHNSAENVAATVRAADEKLTVFSGMEVTSQEEAHILAIFDRPEPALELQEIVYDRLPKDPGVEISIENQIVANEFDEVEAFNTKLLFGATSLPIQKIVDTIHGLGGLAIASHIDREIFSIPGQLGFIPPDLKLDAIEISAATSLDKAKVTFAKYGQFPMITSSDAHFIHDIGRAHTRLLLATPTIEEIHKAFHQIDDRLILPPDLSRQDTNG